MCASATASAPGETSATVDWRQETINSGSLRHVDLQNGSNGWASPPGNLFSLRSQQYLTKKTKSPSAHYLLKPTAVDWLRSPTNGCRKGAPQRSVLLLNRRADRGGFTPRSVHKRRRWVQEQPVEDGEGAMDSEDGGGELQRVSVREGADVSVAQGAELPGGSSKIAGALVHLALGCVTSVTIDMGFLVEAQTEEELPERLIGAVRIWQMEMSSATFLDSSSSTTNTASLCTGVTRLGVGQSEPCR